MKIILNQCDEDTRVEIALGSSYEDNLEAGELIKFLARVHTVCNSTANVDVFFDSRVTKITKHHVWLTTIVKELLVVHPTDNAIWDNTNPYNISLNNPNGTENVANIDVTKEPIFTTTISMSTEEKELWYNTHEEYDL